jgi:hypothetical protein
LFLTLIAFGFNGIILKDLSTSENFDKNAISLMGVILVVNIIRFLLIIFYSAYLKTTKHHYKKFEYMKQVAIHISTSKSQVN